MSYEGLQIGPVLAVTGAVRKYLVFSSLFVSALALGTGCKTDDAVPAASESSSASSSTAAPTPTEKARPGRSAKIDLPRKRLAKPSLESGEQAAPDDAEARRELFRQRREERRLNRQAMLDADGDGTISPEERAAAQQRHMEDLRTRLDTNGDGKLTVEELQGSRMARRLGELSQVDADGDGEISAKELDGAMQRVRERIMERRGGRFGGGPGGGPGDGDAR